MVLVKVLGGIDIISSVVFLLLAFNVTPFLQLILFCSCLLALKGLFVFVGNVLSFFDLIFAIFLILAIFITLPGIMLWIPSLFLMAKGFVSFL